MMDFRGKGVARLGYGLLLLGMLFSGPALAKDSFRVAWSLYVGWMPWGYAADSGILAKWADKYGIDIELVRVDEYLESVKAYREGEFDACAMTNVDALTIPAAAGVDSTAVIVGSFSNGNDGIVLRDAQDLAALRGRKVGLVEHSVSHYLLARALQHAGFPESELIVRNVPDTELPEAYRAGVIDAAVAWNPQLSDLIAMQDAHSVFDSSQIPGEIIDLMVIRTETLVAHPELAKALTGAWYEVIRLMAGNTKAGRAARAAMGRASGSDLAGYEAQLASTRMFYAAASALSFVRSPQLVDTMKDVANFSFDHRLLGRRVFSAGHIGMAFPGGRVIGRRHNIKLRFDDSYMALAAEEAL